MVELEDGSSAVLGITTSSTGHAGIRRKLLSPYGCPGGWVAQDPLTRDAMSTLASVICRGEVIWRVGPSDDLVPDAGLTGAYAEATHVVDLRDGSEAARASWSGSARRQLGRAERASVTVRAGATTDDWEAYRRLYRRTLERWDTPLVTHDDSLFELIPRIAGDETLLVLAEIDGEACSGAVLFLHGRHAAYWHGASDIRSAPGSANALQWRVLEMLESRGVDTYDLLGSGPLAGVIRFKESIGGVSHRVRAVDRSHSLVAAARAGRGLLKRRPPSLRG